MKITWEIYDGYVGKSRSQKTIIPDDELEELSEEEKEDYINKCIQEDFEEKITWYIVREE